MILPVVGSAVAALSKEAICAEFGLAPESCVVKTLPECNEDFVDFYVAYDEIVCSDQDVAVAVVERLHAALLNWLWFGKPNQIDKSVNYNIPIDYG